ncbi:hypothetical protein [Candidatus Spongiihabitans sp.]|uniref:hypothetical protein n=1 Tax=Candidatus Spongiihabitans sp. TaxID=3101308 RepID=UPI003C7B6AF1
MPNPGMGGRPGDGPDDGSRGGQSSGPAAGGAGLGKSVSGFASRMGKAVQGARDAIARYGAPATRAGRRQSNKQSHPSVNQGGQGANVWQVDDQRANVTGASSTDPRAII